MTIRSLDRVAMHTHMPGGAEWASQSWTFVSLPATPANTSQYRQPLFADLKNPSKRDDFFIYEKQPTNQQQQQHPQSTTNNNIPAASTLLTWLELLLG